MVLGADDMQYGDVDGEPEIDDHDEDEGDEDVAEDEDEEADEEAQDETMEDPTDMNERSGLRDEALDEPDSD